MEEDNETIFGMPEEWTAFRARHPLFLERFPNLKEALETAFLRDLKLSDLLDKIIFSLGRLCVEEFFEILLLCGNGYGIAGLKILRGMYEQVVAALYLRDHPEEIQNFLDFFWVQQHRLTEAVRGTFGEPALERVDLAEIESKFREVRERFMVTNCAKCDTKRLNHTWSKLDFVSMAHTVGSVGKFIVPAYYLPTREIHASITALLSHGEEQTSQFVFSSGPQPERVHMALSLAHNLLLLIIKLQKEHFKLNNLEAPLEECLNDFRDIWLPGATQAP